MGLNEIKLGVTVPYPCDCILNEIVIPSIARDILTLGDFYESDKLLTMGLVDEVHPLEDVLPKALEKAKLIGALPEKAFQIIKRNRVDDVVKKVGKGILEKENQFLDCWFSPEARDNLKEAMKTF